MPVVRSRETLLETVAIAPMAAIMASMGNADEASSAATDKTSVQIYVADRDKLQAKQREISFRTGTYVPMFDLIRELVERAGNDLKGA